jgi:mitotic spindle assembly checkpoint protein MAD2
MVCLLAQMVTEFFGYAVNSILYQRGIYPPENFQGVQKYAARH